MTKIKFRKAKRNDIFLYKTMVENLFINEFLPDAPGEYVKVFLFGLMYAQYDEDLDSRSAALTLGLTEEEIKNAWEYWSRKGLVRIIHEDGGEPEIEFIRQIEMFYGRSTGTNCTDIQDSSAEGAETDEAPEAVIERLIDQHLRDLFDKYTLLTGRTISRHETSKLADALKVYNIEPDILDFAVDYCVGIDKCSVDYIIKVALRWTEEGCRDVAQVKNLLDRRSRRSEFYRKIFEAIGFSRPSTPADREIMDKWFDEMGCSIMEVLDACKAAAGIREPNLRYVNRVLENRMDQKGGINTRKGSDTADKERTPAVNAGSRTKSDHGQPARVSRKVLGDYFDYIKREEQRKQYERIDEVISKIPAMKDIFAAESEINNAVLSLAPSERERRQALREQRRSLEDDKCRILVRNGFSEDYLERKYRCNICKDSGYTDEGRTCTCCRERAEEAYEWIRRKGNH